VTNLGWRGTVYVVSVAALVVTALVAILTRGIVRYVAAGVALVAAAAAIVGVGLILAHRHQITTELGVYNGSMPSIGPAPGFKPITPPNGIAVAELHSGGLLFGFVAALMLLLVVLLAVSGRRRAVAGTVFGSALTVGAFVAPGQGAWLIEDGVARYVTFGMLKVNGSRDGAAAGPGCIGRRVAALPEQGADRRDLDRGAVGVLPALLRGRSRTHLDWRGNKRSTPTSSPRSWRWPRSWRCSGQRCRDGGVFGRPRPQRPSRASSRSPTRLVSGGSRLRQARRVGRLGRGITATLTAGRR